MSHFGNQEYIKKRDYVENYYREHNDYKTYFGKALSLNSKDFMAWIFEEYNKLKSLNERHRLCEKGHKCNCENCLKCPFEEETYYI